MIATEEALGVHSARRYLYFVITGPTGPYFRTGRGTVGSWSRATGWGAPGGTGSAKTGGNYAGSLLATAVAREKGCQQVLWLDAVERRHVEEVGRHEPDVRPRRRRHHAADIGDDPRRHHPRKPRRPLPRASLPFVERHIHIEEVLNGLQTGDCTEIFGCGTAAVVSAVGETPRRRQALPRRRRRRGPGRAPLRETLTGIQFGTVPDTHGWLVRV